jgi:CTP synthase N-terminus
VRSKSYTERRAAQDAAGVIQLCTAPLSMLVTHDQRCAATNLLALVLTTPLRVGQANMCLVHVSLVPVLGSVGEQKTKPTQHGVRELRSVGLHPDVICCRSADMLEDSTRRKISIFCHVPVSQSSHFTDFL